MLAQSLLREIEEGAVVGLQRLRGKGLEGVLELLLRLVEQRTLLQRRLALSLKLLYQRGVLRGEVVK